MLLDNCFFFVVVVVFIFILFYKLFWTQDCPEGIGTNKTHSSHARCHPYPIPQPVKVGYTTGVYVPYSFQTVVRVRSTSHKNRSVKVLWEGTYGFSSLSEKTRKSNDLQMSLQRQHFLLSYLKTLDPGPAGVWTHDWANQVAVSLWKMVKVAPRYHGSIVQLARICYMLVGTRSWQDEEHIWIFLPFCSQQRTTDCT